MQNQRNTNHRNTNHRRPAGARQTTAAWTTAALAAWATAAGPAARGQAAPAAPAGERFVADAATVAATGTLSLRPQATVAAADVKLHDVCRWSDADANAFAPLADLTVCRLGDGGSSASLDAGSLRSTLRDAGVNLATVRLAGAATCAVTRDITLAAAVPAAAPTTEPAAAPADRPATAAADAECNPFHTLRERLVADVALRLNLPPADVQVTFTAGDANLLNLAEPTFRFEVEARRGRDLGRVSWDVTVLSGGASQHAAVTADARAWQSQVVLTAPAAYHQLLRDADVTERRVLVTQLPDDAPLTRRQAVGQQAARDLKPGTVLTGKLIDPVPLARAGQYVTVTLCQGGVQVRTVAKALEGGTYGQTIKVKNDSTRDEFEVTLTGPQVATMGPTAGDANLASVRD